MPRAEADPGYGPPPGHPTGPARDGGTPFDVLTKQYLSGLDADTTDPAFRKPIDVTDDNTIARAKLVYRDLPLVTIQNTWSIEQVRGALYAHLVGQPYASAQLCDSMMGDDRVAATLNNRASSLFGRPVRFGGAQGRAKGSQSAQECLDAWQAWWPRLSGDSAIRQTHDYGIMMGFAHDQVLWDREQDGLDYAPYLRPWHSTFSWYDWDRRVFTAITSDGQIPIVPGNGKWLEFAPWGSYRGWIRGALRPCAEPWMLRHFGFRDMARFGEVHGSPTRVGKGPIVGDPVLREEFQAAIKNLGADAALFLPGGIDPKDSQGYAYELVEAKSTAWEVHPAQIDRCDMAIVLAILMTNLTTEIKAGSLAAARVSEDVQSGGTQFDNQTWKATIYAQLARPFAYLNFGDADLAPWTWWDVVNRGEYEANAKQFGEFGKAIEVLRRGGVKFTDVEQVRLWAAERFGLDGLPDFEIVDPVSSGGMGGGA